MAREGGKTTQVGWRLSWVVTALPLVPSPGFVPSCCAVPCHCHSATPSSSVPATITHPTAVWEAGFKA